jgi:hypothetical protein
MNRRIGRMLTLALLILALPMGQGELQTSFSACDGGDCVSSSATYGAGQTAAAHPDASIGACKAPPLV